MFFFVRDTFLFIMAHLFDITLTTVVWLLLQLPIVTAPGATVGLFYFARQAVLQDEAQFKDFVAGVRKYFWKGWLIMLPYLLVVFVLVFDIVFFLSREQPTERLWASVPMALFSLLLVTVGYVFVFFVREESAVLAAVKKAFLLVASHPVFTMAVLLATLLYFIALYMTRIGLLIVFVGPVAVLYTKAVHYLLSQGGIEF